MGQIASAAASKDESHIGMDTFQTMDSSGEESSDEETLSASQDINDIQETPSSQSDSTRLIKPLGIEEVLLQLQKLSTEDLEKRIDMASLTRENILEFTQSHREDLAAMNDKYANTALSRDFEEHVALRILDLSSNLRYLRFKLVPSKIKEGIFWAAIFRMISTDSDTVEPKHEIIPAKEVKTKNTVISTSMETPSLYSSSMNAKLDKAEARIKELEIALEAAYKILRETKGVSLEPRKAHKGRWIVDTDCRDFLSLDEEVKKQLRGGKKKRIQDILNELRFILDSDDEREARGHWECCGNNEYLGIGCSY